MKPLYGLTKFPNNLDLFSLDTDVSDISIGAALYQVQDGVESLVSFASTTLTPVLHHKELLAIVMFARHYKHYLFGREFTLGTDHGSLTWLFR